MASFAPAAIAAANRGFAVFSIPDHASDNEGHHCAQSNQYDKCSHL